MGDDERRAWTERKRQYRHRKRAWELESEIDLRKPLVTKESEVIMLPPISLGDLEELKSDITWGKSRTRSCREVESRLVHPKVARWAEEEYHNVPYFIKVICNTSDYSSHLKNHGSRVTLPAPFVREHYLKMDKDVTLEDAVNGSTSKISFNTLGYDYWRKGWPEFAQKNNLERGKIIVFALVAHSHFVFTVFNDQGCQIIHPSREKQEIKLNSQEDCRVNRSSFHLPSCLKHYSRRVQQKLGFQDDGANLTLDVKNANEESVPQNIGLNKLCQAALSHNFQKPKRKFKASASTAAQDNHKICIHMGFPCGVHHHEQKPTVQPVDQTLDQCSADSDLFDQCQKGLEQIQITECMDTHQPLVEERALSVMTMSEANSEGGNIFEESDDQASKKAHLDPIWFTFMSKRRVVTNVEKREAKTAASRYSRTLRRPNSMTVMMKSHVYKEFIMDLPKTLLLLGNTVEFPQPPLTLVDSVGRSWEMQWYASGRHRLALVPKDWALFAVHHFLEEGDACVFEATDIAGLTILVRIFRVVDIPDNLGTDGIYTHYLVEFAI